MGGDDDLLDYSIDPLEGMGPNFIFPNFGQCSPNLYLDKKNGLDL